MTRGTMETIVGARIAEYIDIPVDDNPLALRREVWMAADYVAERTRCHYTGFTLPITSGTSRYCPGGLLEVTNVVYKASDGDWKALPVYTRMRMDRVSGALWRNDDAEIDARALVVHGPNAIEIYPAPSQTRAAALRMEGYYLPGEYWVYNSSGAAQAPAASDECPLPNFAHSSVIEFALLARLRVLVIKYPELQGALPIVERYANSLLGEVEASAARYWQMAKISNSPLWRD